MAIVNLITNRDQIKSEVIEKLEEALESARNGEIVSVAIACVMSNGGIRTGFARTDTVGNLLGAITYLQHRVCNSVE